MGTFFRKSSGTGSLSHWSCFCAGVIWRGDSLIDGVPETLDMLRAMVRPVAESSAAAVAAVPARAAGPWLCSDTAGARPCNHNKVQRLGGTHLVLMLSTTDGLA